MNLDVREAARLLGLTEDQVHALAAKGELPSRTIREQLRFDRVELLEWAQVQRRKVDTRMLKRSRGGAPTVRISDALAKGGIHRGVAATDARAALQAIAALLPLPPGVDRETVTSLFGAQERCVTAQGGIAIPHARAPTVLPVEEAVVALFLFDRPIDMKAADGKPVRAAFAVLSPTIRSHLHILARLAGKLSDETLDRLVNEQAGDPAILARLRELEAHEPASGEGAVR